MDDKTHWAQRRAEKAFERLEGLRLDSEREQRTAVSECRACFYLDRGRIVGHAFTPFRCQLGDHEAQHENTGVPKACRECATTAGKCRRCLGDFDWSSDFPRRHVNIYAERAGGPAPDWTQQTVPERIESCVSTLYRYGIVTDGEMRKVRPRVEKLRAR